MKTKNIFGLFVLGLLLFTHPIVEAEPAHLNKIVAVVNKDVITQHELDRRLALMKRQMASDNALEGMVSLRQRTLDDLIDISLQLQLAKRTGIQITDKELNVVIANIAKSHNITLEKLKEVLPEQEGMSFTEFRNQLREQGIMAKLQQRELGRELSVDDKDIKAVLLNPPKIANTPPLYHVVDILFEVEEGAQDRVDAVKNVAKKTLAVLQSNSDIEAVIKESQNSLKENIKSEDLGWRKINELPELFAQEVAKMKENQTVGPIQAPNGIHLLKLLAIRGSSVAAMKITKDQAADIAYRRKLADKLTPWLKELRETAYIKIIK